jgi:hydrogenase/urease accessory protein HupE
LKKIPAFFFSLIVSVAWTVSSGACAHPILQDSLEGVWTAQTLNLQARVTLEEALALEPGRRLGSGPAEVLASQASFERYAKELARGLHGQVGGRPLTFDVKLVSRLSLADLRKEDIFTPALYQITAVIPSPGTGRLVLSQDFLKGKTDPTGSPWSVIDSVKLAQSPGGQIFEGPLSAAQAFVADPERASSAAGLAWAYLKEGFFHILTGYDHLCFVSALTLAASSLLNLVSVVGLFTLAHTFTLVLAVLGYAHLSSRVVEPGIAASIVVVALLNLAASRRAQAPLGWKRLAAAFGFGLFHGLGFAGGLLNAMRHLPGASQGLALASFSAGVELGHLGAVIPLYLLLRAGRQRWGQAFQWRALRWGSGLIAASGFYYLCLDLWQAFS